MLAVAVVMSSAAALSMRSLDRRRLYNASLILQADLRYMQRMAMLEGRRYRLEFNMFADRYEIFSMNPKQSVKVVALPEGVVLADVSSQAIEYLPRGTVSVAFSVALEKGDYRQRLTATVSGGRVMIYDITVIDTSA